MKELELIQKYNLPFISDDRRGELLDYIFEFMSNKELEKDLLHYVVENILLDLDFIESDGSITEIGKEFIKDGRGRN